MNHNEFAQWGIPEYGFLSFRYKSFDDRKTRDIDVGNIGVIMPVPDPTASISLVD